MSIKMWEAAVSCVMLVGAVLAAPVAACNPEYLLLLPIIPLAGVWTFYLHWRIHRDEEHAKIVKALQDGPGTSRVEVGFMDMSGQWPLWKTQTISVPQSALPKKGSKVTLLPDGIVTVEEPDED